MKVRRMSAASVLGLVTLAGCGPAGQSAQSSGTWVGTITTAGNVTTVVNESGSLWGGKAALVEEASIGVAVGADEEMLGEIGGLHATDDEIYLVDRSVSKVRVYDLAGNHLRSFGGAGQGPGELGSFTFGVAVGSDGRVYVGDFNNQRINIYSPEGEPVGDLPLPTQAACCRLPIVFAEGGGIWLQVRVPGQDAQSTRDTVRAYTADGPVGEPVLVPELEYDRRSIRVRGRDVAAVPFAAGVAWTFSYDQALVAGASDRYAFQMIRPSGEITLVERFWEPVPVEADEREFWRRFTIAQFSRETDFSWNGDDIPDHKPAYLTFLPAASGELWVLRQGGGGLGECDLEPEAALTSGDQEGLIACLFPHTIIDAFDRDGRYLGEVDSLPFGTSNPFISGDTVIAEVHDEAGTIMVKRYRLMPPGGEQP